jgi:hypothetical protein
MQDRCLPTDVSCQANEGNRNVKKLIFLNSNHRIDFKFIVEDVERFELFDDVLVSKVQD